MFCRKKGLLGEETLDIQEWLLDLVWMDKNSSAVLLAVESELQQSKKGLVDDFLKLMVTKAPLKLFIYERSGDVPGVLAERLDQFPHHLEGEEYLLMHLNAPQPEFYYFKAPNSRIVANVKFDRLSLGSGSSA